MAMLEGVADLTLQRLNEISQVWVEQEYHLSQHAEIGTSPLRRFLDAPQVGRECPDSHTLRRAFCCLVTRRQRRSDGTISLAGKRFEIPSRYRHLNRPQVRYARWDLRTVELVDPHTLVSLCPLYPLDKHTNANAQRRELESMDGQSDAPPAHSGSELPPLLRKLLADYAATGRPPAYLPKHPQDSETST